MNAVVDQNAIPQRMTGQMRQHCPVCNDRARIRSSVRITPTITEYHIQCMNTDCGGTWKAQMEIVYLLSPSAIENPDVIIPMAPAGISRKTYLLTNDEKDFDDRQIPMFDME